MLNDYLLYTSTQESPKCYHTWVAFSLVAACLERNVWLDRGFYKVFPNLYTMIIGDSAVYKKSTAVEMGTDLLEELTDKPVMFEGQITIPSLIQDIAAEKKDMVTGKYVPNSRVFIIAPELALFLRDELQAREIIYFLTDFYTGKTKPWKKRTVTGKPADIISPCINFIGCSTAEWLAKGLCIEDFGGGFMGRCLFIVPTEPPKRIAHPIVTEEQKAARGRVMAMLAHARTLRGEYQLTDSAEAFYDNWYTHQPTVSASDRLRGYYERKATNVLKLALIKAVMDDLMIVDKPEVQWALDMLNSLEPSMGQAFQFIGTDENVLAELIVAHLSLCGGKDSYVRLINILGPRLRNVHQFESVVGMLIKQERVRRVVNGAADTLVLNV